MIAVYAMGDGLGHLTRVAAARHTLGVEATDMVVLTNADRAADPRVTGSVTIELVEPDDVAAALHELRPTELWVDAFPSGLRGELQSSDLPSSIETTRHLARLLRWDAYGPLLGPQPIEYDIIHVLEPLSPDHADRLAMIADDLSPLVLRDPPTPASPEVVAWFDALRAPRWLVVHAGPVTEVQELVDYARAAAEAEGISPSIGVIAPQTVDGVPGIDGYPAWPLFADADRVITAAGFNAMRQAQGLAGAERHRYLPFARRYDDQFERARRARSCTSPA